MANLCRRQLCNVLTYSFEVPGVFGRFQPNFGVFWADFRTSCQHECRVWWGAGLIHVDTDGRTDGHNDAYEALFAAVLTKICRTIILPVVLYGCETWSLTLREEHRLRVFENRV
jgi:hypothetical protein